MTNFKHDEDQGRYQVEVAPNQWAHLDYSAQGEVLAITHTFVPDELRGQGCGKVLMETVLKDMEASGKKVKPICSYAVVYLQRQTQWQHLLAN
ncbi:GNAT family N-acetyltransferase [Vibrio rumoiensis]|uniref:Acetyltransferase n=1 Tax=Vibrio rumoiensis 1S-45 TaxID=1188252 RepID=A0A1E5E3U3_9VIBR|nr:GNAT family N-acetyltransferase [Vibrio rumoiensis]OEF26287.1 acetyltransferase [Vibrio rumoiensis 1S-45]